MNEFHSLSIKGINSMEKDHLQFLSVRCKMHEGIALQPEEQTWMEKWLQMTGMPEKVEMSPEKMEVVAFVLKNRMTFAAFTEKLKKREQEQAAAMNISEEKPAEEINEPAVPYKKFTMRRHHWIAAAAVSCGIILGIVAIQSNLSKESIQEIVKTEIILAGNEEMKSGVMSDGTRYWVNASSSISFPSSFKKKREVELQGEAYFEVKPDPEKPFIVTSKGQKVEVLGTAFNISAYNDDAIIRTTVLEGSVMVTALNRKQILEARQQLVLNPSRLKVIPAKPEETIAWKKDSFSFKQASITEIAAELSRYYGVRMEFANGVNNDLYTLANFSRKEPITRILHMIESTNNIAFDIPNSPVNKGDVIIIRNK